MQKEDKQDVLETFKRNFLSEEGLIFPHTEPSMKYRKVMVGDKKPEVKFKELLQVARETAAISFVIGRSGAGKSHFLNHLYYHYYDHKDNDNDFKVDGIYLKYKMPREEEFRIKDLMKALFTDPSYESKIRERLDRWIRKLEYENPDFSQYYYSRLLKEVLRGRKNIDDISENEYDKILDFIIQIMERNQIKYPVICFAFDDVDEYIRGIEHKTGKTAKEILEGLSLKLRAISRPGILILLAVTRDAYMKIYETLKNMSDPSLIRRFMLGDPEKGYKIYLEGYLSKIQAAEMIQKYLELWANSKGIRLPKIGNCIVKNGRNEYIIYPFTEDFVHMVYEACDKLPQGILFACSIAHKHMKQENKMFIVGRMEGLSILAEAHDSKSLIYPKFNETVRAISRDEVRGLVEAYTRRHLQKYLNLDRESFLKVITQNILLLVKELGYKVMSPLEVNITPQDLPSDLRSLGGYGKVTCTAILGVRDKKIALQLVIGRRPSPQITDCIKRSDMRAVFLTIYSGHADRGLFITFYAEGVEDLTGKGVTFEQLKHKYHCRVLSINEHRKVNKVLCIEDIFEDFKKYSEERLKEAARVIGEELGLVQRIEELIRIEEPSRDLVNGARRRLLRTTG
ncbi:MAG: hypothetical protein J7L47_07290 [Candidatus Odinarchaeota archaeon]|nr:hypothetical protein [Candidatus Odinarchaeota archaeon]